MKQIELIEVPDVSRRISLSETQVRNLRSLGVLNSTSYIYLAIKIMEEESKDKYVDFNLVEFAERWHLRLIEIRKSLITLEDKGLISSDFADAHIISAT
ncbi:MAG: hypothetical protein ACK52E_16300 [Aphanizomenon sp.]|jgi:hypothetical protein